MAEQDTGQERTEEATSRRKEQAKGKGQVVRSKELGTAAVLLGASLGLIMIGPQLAEQLYYLMKAMFSLHRKDIYDANLSMNIWSSITESLLMPFLGFIFFVAITAMLGNIAVGGLSFSAKAITPKTSKINPLNGVKRMFGIQAGIELIKGIAKFSVVVIVAYILLLLYFDDILLLTRESLPNNIFHGLDILLWMFMFLCGSMFFIVMIDVPFQIWNHNKQLKMTKQEVKDEFKDTEGKPEVKGRVKQMQRELAQRRMMTEVPNADVIVVNPEHYAIAIRYDVTKSPAPYVIAKGTDEIAFKIREIGNEYKIDIVSAPPLARAIYYTTKISQQVPKGLYTAVAQVLAYVFQLRQYRKGVGNKPTPLPKEQPIPDKLRY